MPNGYVGEESHILCTKQVKVETEIRKIKREIAVIKFKERQEEKERNIEREEKK